MSELTVKWWWNGNGLFHGVKRVFIYAFLTSFVGFFLASDFALVIVAGLIASITVVVCTAFYFDAKNAVYAGFWCITGVLVSFGLYELVLKVGVLKSILISCAVYLFGKVIARWLRESAGW
jgi:hypothetical protein